MVSNHIVSVATFNKKTKEIDRIYQQKYILQQLSVATFKSYVANGDKVGQPCLKQRNQVLKRFQMKNDVLPPASAAGGGGGGGGGM